MSRFDKYDPYSGGFRAPLAAAIASTEAGKLKAVSLDASGRAVIGGTAATDLVGVICPVRGMAAGEIIDVMTAGEITDATLTAGTALTPGGLIYGHIDGTLDAVATAGKIVAAAVEADRAVVRCPLG